MKKLVALVFLLGLAGFVAWVMLRPAPPREVNFARASRQTLVSNLTTNAKLEPREFAIVRASREGVLVRVKAERGQHVTPGQMLAEVEAREAQSEIASAEARIAQAETELKLFDAGGNPAAIAEIETARQKATLELDTARKEVPVLERLVEKNAATKQELTQARERARQIEAELAALELKRKALVPAGRGAIEARLRDARTSLELARSRMEQSAVRSPISGVIYSVAVKAGAFVRPGDEIAQVGRTEMLKAVVYVDEPELGRIGVGMPVQLTWDALPGRQWPAKVETMPTQISALGTRQVGEVVCRVDNGDGVLPPGANVNASIESKVVQNALTVPKAAIRREGEKIGVLLLTGETVQWRPVTLGTSSVTMTEVTGGLQPGEAVALPTETALTAGERVAPRFP
ncbi:MAG: efflux RND transporter periplasmic adaptor subunit [Bryobacteraceae bacterium]